MYEIYMVIYINSYNFYHKYTLAVFPNLYLIMIIIKLSLSSLPCSWCQAAKVSNPFFFFLFNKSPRIEITYDCVMLTFMVVQKHQVPSGNKMWIIISRLELFFQLR